MKLIEKDLGIFGKVFAGRERHLPKNKPEPNTPEEIDFITQLDAYIDSPTVKLPIDFSLTIENLIKSGQYKDIFVEPYQQEVYRGMYLRRDKIDGFISKLGLKNQEINQKKGKIDNFLQPVIFKPNSNRNFSSWTKNLNIANHFSTAGAGYDGVVEIILVAKIIDNKGKFFDLRNWYNQINPMNMDEEEVICIGDVVISSIKWFRT